VLLAALILDVTGDNDSTSPLVVARKTCQRLDVGAATEQAVAGLVADIGLMLGASRRLDGLGEESVLQLAAHLGSVPQSDGLYRLTEAYFDLDPHDRARLSVLHGLLRDVLGHPELVSRTATNTIEQRRAQAARLVGDHVDAGKRIEHAPRAYLLRVAPEDIARHVATCDPVPAARVVRVTASAMRPGTCSIDVVARDRSGLLARETAVLANFGLEIDDAVAATWADGCALASFQIRSTTTPDDERLRTAIEAALAEPLTSAPLDAVDVEFDNDASPWHTLCSARADDSRRLLQGLTSALAAVGVNVHAAQVHRDHGAVLGIFQITNAKGHKLEPDVQQRVVELVRTGVTEPAARRPSLRRRRSRWRPVPA
jgi:UTP:GlnB (protein PII) uridylyltransferase